MYKHPLPLASTAHPCAFCLTALDLLPRSLLAPSALQCKPVFLPLTLSGCPPFDTLDVVSVPANSCGFSLLGSVLPLPFLEPLLPPFQPRPAARSLTVQRGVMPPITGFLFSSSVFPLHPILWLSVSWCLLAVWRLMGALLRADERPGRLHSLTVARPSPCPRNTRPCRSCSGHPEPPQ